MTAVIGEIRQCPYDDVDARRDLATSQAAHGPLVQDFSRLFYQAPHTWGITRYQGAPVMKAPTDLWTYHEWIHALQPTLIIETGTAFGGSAAFFADQIPHGKVFSIDNQFQPGRPERQNITYWHGSSTSASIITGVYERAYDHSAIMVVLDSNHHTDHVLAELEAYGPLVTPNQLLVVEDTNISDPAFFGRTVDGPGQALEAWLPAHPEFQREPLCERFLLTFHPGGWLRRVA